MTSTRTAPGAPPRDRSAATSLLFLALGLLLIGHGGQGLTSPPAEGALHQALLWAQVVAGASFVVSLSLGLARRSSTDR